MHHMPGLLLHPAPVGCGRLSRVVMRAWAPRHHTYQEDQVLAPRREVQVLQNVQLQPHERFRLVNDHRVILHQQHGDQLVDEGGVPAAETGRSPSSVWGRGGGGHLHQSSTTGRCHTIPGLFLGGNRNDLRDANRNERSRRRSLLHGPDMGTTTDHTSSIEKWLAVGSGC